MFREILQLNNIIVLDNWLKELMKCIIDVSKELKQ